MTDRINLCCGHLACQKAAREAENAEASERKMTELNIRNRARYDMLRKEILNYATENAFSLPDVARDLRHIIAANERATREDEK